MIKFFIENYGCQMNSSEKDSLHLNLLENGFIEAAGPFEADVAIINTCCVRKTAEERIEGRLGYYRGLRDKKGSSVKVVFMGCMAQNRGREIMDRFPDVVAAVWGTYNKDSVIEFIKQLSDNFNYLDQKTYRFMEAAPETGHRFKSYVPISHGCNNYCSYCIVPHVRGKEVCRKSGDIIDNIQALIDKGVLEVTLLGQNVNSYRDGRIDFPELLDKISIKTGIQRLSFLTSHPRDFSKALADVIKTHDNILKTVHLPLQSGNDRILSLMNRNYTFDQYLEKIGWVKEIPGVFISTDIITGFPTETDTEFLDTLNAMKIIRFDEAFMYYYNPRKGTPACSLKPILTIEIKKQRLAVLIKLQKQILSERLSHYIGFKTKALMESVSRKDPNELTGRSQNGLMVFLKGNESMIGRILPVEMVSPSGMGLKAKIIV